MVMRQFNVKSVQMKIKQKNNKIGNQQTIAISEL